MWIIYHICKLYAFRCKLYAFGRIRQQLHINFAISGEKCHFSQKITLILHEIFGKIHAFYFRKCEIFVKNGNKNSGSVV